MKKIIIYGAGGHARVVIDTLEKEGKYAIIGLIDDINPRGKKVLGYDILGGKEVLPDLFESGIHNCLIAIGDNGCRRTKTEEVLQVGFNLVSTIHPFASVGLEVTIEKGVVIFPGAILDPNIILGRGVIVNHKASIGHNSFIGDFTHVSAASNCGAWVTIGENSFIGMGATIVSNIKIGNNVFIGAGSLVTKDVPDNTKAVGRPVKIIRGNRISDDA